MYLRFIGLSHIPATRILRREICALSELKESRVAFDEFLCGPGTPFDVTSNPLFVPKKKRMPLDGVVSWS